MNILITAQYLLLINIISTFIMIGIIWTVQRVNYPLFSVMDEASFLRYHKSHVLRITSVVALPMLAEAFSAVLLMWYPHPQMPPLCILGGVVLIFVIWLTTLFFQAGQHHTLIKGFNVNVHRRLVLTNWIRTIAWSGRGVLMGYVLSLLL